MANQCDVIGVPRLNLVMEPDLKIRCWRLMSELPHGPISWSLAENKRFLQQIAKMKFNRIQLQLWPTQPFVHYVIDGIAKPMGNLYFGEHFPIDDDMIGREKFGNAIEFTNPELANPVGTEDMHKRAVHLLQSILSEAKRLGMNTAIAINPTEWPREFAPALKGTGFVKQIGSLALGPDANHPSDDAVLRKAATTLVKAYVDTYPDIDYLTFSMPEHGHWTEHAAEAFDYLTTTYGVKDSETFEQLCARARSRDEFPGGGDRVERQLKSDLNSLGFLDLLLREYHLLERPGGSPDIKFIYDSITEELYPLVVCITPAGGEVISFIDYTASRQLQRSELIQTIASDNIPASLIFTLADDNVGILPQLATGSLHQLMKILRERNWSGFSTRYWTISDLDPTIHLLARVSWDSSLTPQGAYSDQITHVCSPKVVGPVLNAFFIIEKITTGLDQHGMGLGFLIPQMMTHHYDVGSISEEICDDRRLYMQALRMIEKASAVSSPAGQIYLIHFLNRVKFAVHYLYAVEYFAATGRSVREGLLPEAALHSEQAYDSIREALQAYADVADDHGDLGAIAAPNKYCYHPIRDKRNEFLALKCVENDSLLANAGRASSNK